MNVARFAISAGSPKRPRGIRDSVCAFAFSSAIRREKAPSVGIGPGAIAFSRIPAEPHSTASERVIARTPAFAQAEGRTYAEPLQTYVAAIETMEPAARRASRWRPTARVQWTEP